MEDSQPLRRSTRNSVVMKNEELTPRKKKVSTPVKVEPSTPSRRTRASSATPKKNLIEVMNTPKKILPVLNEEENPANSSRTPVKKSKEISPKTPSRRRTVRESVSTPTKVSVDKSTKKSVEASGELNVTASRPLTRAKRKTLGGVQVAEVTKVLESEKGIKNKKDKAESDKVIQNKEDKPSDKSASIDDKTNNSPDSKSNKKEVESCFALVPRVFITDIGKQQLKNEENTENVIEENDCGVFKTNSPVRAEDIAINSPRKVPENCKSFSESSIMSDSAYVNSKSQKITVGPGNSITSLENTDIISESTTCKSPINSNLTICSPQKVPDSKNNDIPNIIVTTPSPQKVINSKDDSIPNIVVTSPSPQKVLDSKDNDRKNDLDSSFTSGEKTSPRKDEKNFSVAPVDVEEKDMHVPSKPEILTSVDLDSENTYLSDNGNESKSPDKRTEKETLPEKINENSKFSTEQKLEVSENPEMKVNEKSACDELRPVTTHSPKKVDTIENSISNDINESNLIQAVMQVSSVEIPHTIEDTDTNLDMSQNENEELDKTSNRAKSYEIIPDSSECIIVCARKSNTSDSHVPKDPNNGSEMASAQDNINEAVIKDTTPIKDKEINESKLNNSLDETFNLDASFLNESSVENNHEEDDTVTSSISAVKEQVIVEITEVGSQKDDGSTTDEVSPSSADISSDFPNKVSSNITSTEPLDEDKKVNEITQEVNIIQNNSEQVDKSSREITDQSSPAKPNNASSPKQSSPAENKSDTGKKIVKESLGTNVEKDNENSHDSNPLFFIRCECEASDDSGDSGIQNDDNVLIFKMSSQFKKLITSDEVNLPKNMPEHSKNECTKKDVLKSDDLTLKDFDNTEAHSSEVSHEEGENSSEVSESVTSDVKCSPRKADINTVQDRSDSPLLVEEKTKTVGENIQKSSTEDTVSKTTSLEAVLMSPNDFLNSDEESNVDCENIEDTQSKNRRESCGSKSSEELVDTDHLKHPISETQESVALNVTLSNSASSEDGSIMVDEKQDDSDVNNKTEIIPIDSKICDEVKDSSINQEKEVSLQKYYEEKIDDSKDSRDNQICDNKSKPVSTNDFLEKTVSSKPFNSIEDNENNVSKTERDIQDSLNSSQTIRSPEVEVEKSLDGELSNKQVGIELKSDSPVNDSDPNVNSTDGDGQDKKVSLESVKKITKNIRNKRKNISKKLESETDSSESDADSNLSSNPSATEGSSDGPLCGKDFIDFEAEEGEETSEDDSFIVSTGEESSESSSSDAPSLKMKLRKRKRNLDSESDDSCNYVESVQRLFDNSEEHSKYDILEDNPIIKKKPKLEKATTVRKKTQRPKSILRNTYTAFESARNRQKIRTENKVIKESSKTGIFIVSNISQHFEEPKLSRNSSKRRSKLRMEQKKSEISDYNCVPENFSISDAGNNVVDDAALRGFVVSYDESYLITKKPRKAVTGNSVLISRKKKINEGKNTKKTVKKSLSSESKEENNVKKTLSSESKEENKNEKISPYVVTLVLPVSMTSRSVTNVITDLGLGDISSINFPRNKIAVIEFSNEEPFKKILKLYGELKINNKPIYILEGCSLL